jgi:hypothetical protein
LSGNKPVQRSKPVERNHKLQNVRSEKDVITDSLFTIGNQVTAIDGTDQKSDVYDDSLAKVQEVKGSHRNPLLFLKTLKSMPDSTILNKHN